MFNCTDHLIGQIEISSQQQCSLCGTAAFLITVIVITLLVNIVVLVMISSFQYSKSPDVHIFSLATMNLGNALGPVLISVIVSLSGNERINFVVACKVWYWFYTFQTLFSSSIIVFLSFECLRLVFTPSHSPEPHIASSIKSIVFIVVLSALLSSCPFMGWGELSLRHGMCIVEMNTGLGICLVIIWYTQLIITVLSLMLFAFMYRRHLKIHLTPRVTNLYTDRNQSEAGPSSSGVGSWMNERTRAARLAEYHLLLQDAKKLSRLVGAITVFHFLLWLPSLVTLTRELITGTPYDEWLCWCWQFSLIGGVLSPVIYALTYKTYRRGLKSIFSSCLHCTPGKISIPRSMRKNRVSPENDDDNTVTGIKELPIQ